MRAVVQRVSRASVDVGVTTVGQIADGLLVLLGVGHDDTLQDVEKLVEKIAGLRIFSDTQGKMNLSVQDVHGGILLVSQFTLYADCTRGTRPSFIGAADPDRARDLYQAMAEQFLARDIHTETGEFGEEMDVELVNHGPVTILLDSK